MCGVGGGGGDGSGFPMMEVMVVAQGSSSSFSFSFYSYIIAVAASVGGNKVIRKSTPIIYVVMSNVNQIHSAMGQVRPWFLICYRDIQLKKTL